MNKKPPKMARKGLLHWHNLRRQALFNLLATFLTHSSMVLLCF